MVLPQESMTPEQLSLISETVGIVVADADRFSTRFYERLFELAPATRKLFPGDLTEQRGKLVDELAFLAGAATDLPAFIDRARHLGARHQTYGVRPGDYDIVRTALLDSLALVVGAQWTADSSHAWQALYRLIAETMLEGAAEALFTAGQ
jgi:nitric oxide dioxygenase